MNREILALAVLAAVLLAVSPVARAVTWWVLRGAGTVVVGLVALAVVVVRCRRRERPTARQIPAMAYRWHVRVFVQLDTTGRAVPLARGVVTGPWTAATDVERDAMTRWVQVHGWPASGRLCSRAEPVLTGRGVR